MFKWVKIIAEVLEWVLPLWSKYKKNKVEKELEIVTTGVQAFSKSNGAEESGQRLKHIIKGLAQVSGVEKRLHKRIKKYEEKLWGPKFQ